MLRYDWDGDQYIEKCARFLKNMFEWWQEIKCNHDVTIILFSRTFYGKTEAKITDP